MPDEAARLDVLAVAARVAADALAALVRAIRVRRLAVFGVGKPDGVGYVFPCRLLLLAGACEFKCHRYTLSNIQAPHCRSCLHGPGAAPCPSPAPAPVPHAARGPIKPLGTPSKAPMMVTA